MRLGCRLSGLTEEESDSQRKQRRARRRDGGAALIWLHDDRHASNSARQPTLARRRGRHPHQLRHHEHEPRACKPRRHVHLGVARRSRVLVPGIEAVRQWTERRKEHDYQRGEAIDTVPHSSNDSRRRMPSVQGPALPVYFGRMTGNSDIGATGSSAALRIFSSPVTRRSSTAGNA